MKQFYICLTNLEWSRVEVEVERRRLFVIYHVPLIASPYATHIVSVMVRCVLGYVYAWQGKMQTCLMHGWTWTPGKLYCSFQWEGRRREPEQETKYFLIMKL